MGEIYIAGLDLNEETEVVDCDQEEFILATSRELTDIELDETLTNDDLRDLYEKLV